MIDLHIRHERLVEKIKEAQASAIDDKQVNRRLKNLQLDVLKQTKRKLTDRRSQAHLERSALVHPDYLDFLDKIADTGHSHLRHRVEYETHLMLFKARQSLRKHARP